MRLGFKAGRKVWNSTRAAHQLEKDLLEDVNSISSVRRLAANPLDVDHAGFAAQAGGKTAPPPH